MASRIELQTRLEEILASRNVYYQPPESIKLKYPCIVYELSDIDTLKANNNAYLENRSYQLMLIDRDPDSDFVEPILHMPTCRFDRSYAANGLNHFVFTIYY